MRVVAVHCAFNALYEHRHRLHDQRQVSDYFLHVRDNFGKLSELARVSCQVNYLGVKSNTDALSLLSVRGSIFFESSLFVLS